MLVLLLMLLEEILMTSTNNYLTIKWILYHTAIFTESEENNNYFNDNINQLLKIKNCSAYYQSNCIFFNFICASSETSTNCTTAILKISAPAL